MVLYIEAVIMPVQIGKKERQKRGFSAKGRGLERV